MNINEFLEYRQGVLDKATQIAHKKGKDYTKGSEDPFIYFKEVAETYGVNDLQAFGILAEKGWKAIQNYIKTGGQSESEPIEDRVVDLINYSLLFLGMVKGGGENCHCVCEGEDPFCAFNPSGIKYQERIDIDRDLSDKQFEIDQWNYLFASYWKDISDYNTSPVNTDKLFNDIFNLGQKRFLHKDFYDKFGLLVRHCANNIPEKGEAFFNWITGKPGEWESDCGEEDQFCFIQPACNEYQKRKDMEKMTMQAIPTERERFLSIYNECKDEINNDSEVIALSLINKLQGMKKHFKERQEWINELELLYQKKFSSNPIPENVSYVEQEVENYIAGIDPAIPDSTIIITKEGEVVYPKIDKPDYNTYKNPIIGNWDPRYIEDGKYITPVLVNKIADNAIEINLPNEAIISHDSDGSFHHGINKDPRVLSTSEQDIYTEINYSREDIEFLFNWMNKYKDLSKRIENLDNFLFTELYNIEILEIRKIRKELIDSIPSDINRFGNEFKKCLVELEVILSIDDTVLLPQRPEYTEPEPESFDWINPSSNYYQHRLNLRRWDDLKNNEDIIVPVGDEWLSLRELNNRFKKKNGDNGEEEYDDFSWILSHRNKASDKNQNAESGGTELDLSEFGQKTSEFMKRVNDNWIEWENRSKVDWKPYYVKVRDKAVSYILSGKFGMFADRKLIDEIWYLYCSDMDNYFYKDFMAMIMPYVNPKKYYNPYTEKEEGASFYEQGEEMLGFLLYNLQILSKKPYEIEPVDLNPLLTENHIKTINESPRLSDMARELGVSIKETVSQSI